MILKRTLFIILIFIPSIAFSQVAVGIFGALDNSKFSGDKPVNFSYEFKNGYALGLVFETSLEEDVVLSFRPNYTQGGAQLAKEIDEGPTLFDNQTADSVYLFPITNKYVALPVMVQVYASNVFYGSAGLDFAYQFSSTSVDFNGRENDITERLNPWIVSAIFGFGFSIPVKSTSFNVEATYAQGLNTLTKKENIDAGSAPRIRTSRFRLTMYFMIFASKRK